MAEELQSISDANAGLQSISDANAELPSISGANQPTKESVLGRAGRRGAEAFKETASTIGQAFLPPSEKDREKYTGVSGALKSAKEMGAGLASIASLPLSYPVGALGSLGASGLAAGTRAIESGIANVISRYSPERGEKARTSIPSQEELTQRYEPGMEAAISAIGARRAPTGAVAPRTPTTRYTGKPDEVAGRLIESRATDPAKVRETLAQPPAEIVPGSEPTTFQATRDPGLGQLERFAETRDQAGFQQRFAEQNLARVQQLQAVQETGSPEAVADHVRGIFRETDSGLEAAQTAAQNRAWEQSYGLGGHHDPEIYGQLLRHELEQANAAFRARENELWRAIDPENSLVTGPVQLQRAERNIYAPREGDAGRLGAAEAATITPREQEISGIIQGYRGAQPLQEMTDLRSLISAAIREERIKGPAANNRAIARLTQLRGAIEDTVRNHVLDLETGRVLEGAAQRLHVEALQRATAATAERKTAFKPLAQVLRTEGLQGPYRMQHGAVAANITKDYDSMSNFLRAVGNREGVPVVQDALAASMRRAAVQDGLVNPNRLEAWMRKNQDALRALDERDGGAFSQQLRNAGSATEVIGQIAERRAILENEMTTGVFGKLAGATDRADINNIIGRVFGGDERVANARNLRHMLTTPEAQEGARRSIVEYMLNKFVSNAERGTIEQGLVRAEQFQNFVRENKAALGQFFNPEQVANLEAIAADLRRTNLSVGTKVRGASNTAQDILLLKQGETSILTRLLAHGLAHKLTAGTRWLPMVGRGVANAIEAGMGKIREAGVNKVSDLVSKAMLDPALARDLLQKAQGTPRFKGLKRWSMYEAAALHEQASDKGRFKGGRVIHPFRYQEGGAIELDPEAKGFAEAVSRLPRSENIQDRRQQGTLGHIGNFAKQLYHMSAIAPSVQGWILSHLGLRNPQRVMRDASEQTQELGKGTQGARFLNLPNTALGPMPPSAVQWADRYERYRPYSFQGFPHLDKEGTHLEYVPWQDARGGYQPREMSEEERAQPPISIRHKRGGAVGKISKVSANYRDRPKGSERCGGCSMFRSPKSCTAVIGTISPAGWCRLWKAK